LVEVEAPAGRLGFVISLDGDLVTHWVDVPGEASFREIALVRPFKLTVVSRSLLSTDYAAEIGLLRDGRPIPRSEVLYRSTLGRPARECVLRVPAGAPQRVFLPSPVDLGTGTWLEVPPEERSMRVDLDQLFGPGK